MSSKLTSRHEFKAFRLPDRKAVYSVLLSVCLVAACAGSETNSGTNGFTLSDDQVSSEQTPLVLRQLSEDSTLLSPVPQVVFTQTLANTGVRVSYTDLQQRVSAPATVIEQQWVHMQTCLQVVGEPPLVLVRDLAVEPFTPTDEVVRNEVFEAFDVAVVPIASASTLYGTVIQIVVADFDGSLGLENFNLRSIMGRHLWLSANLLERDYPFECATQLP